MDKGYIHIYTGTGKGKTTAAFGLALRAICSGKNVFIGQFIKSISYHENRLTELLANADDTFGNLHIELFGRGCFINNVPDPVDIAMAHDGLKRCADALQSHKYDLVILDELNVALYFHLVDIDEVLILLRQRTPAVEVVITGRRAPQQLIEESDLVTDMQEIKHYYRQGVLSRDGIDR